MRSIYSLLLILMVSISTTVSAQTRNNSMEKKGSPWEKVDSLVDIGKPASAKKAVAEILKSAEAKKQTDEIIKAKTWLIALDLQQENADAIAIKTLENEIAKTNNIVEKAIWQNRTANAYNNYFQNNRWTIYQQTILENNTSEDIATWDARKFYQKISSLYLASIANRQALQAVPSTQYLAIIDQGINTSKLRPSIYDILVFDALDYFSSDETGLTQAAYQFFIDDPKYFEPATAFSKLNIQSKDSNSLDVQALKLYQEILQKNSQSDNIAGLIDADIKRLHFVYQKATMSNKAELFQNALLALAKTYEKYPEAAQALYLAISNQYSTKINESYYLNEEEKQAILNEIDLKSIRASLLDISKKYPQSEGAFNAENLVKELETNSIEMTLENAYIPNETSKFLLSYSNVQSVNISIYNTTLQQSKNEKYLGKRVRTWEQKLPNSDDYKRHSVEIKLDELPAGLYSIIIKDAHSDLSIQQLLQVSNLSAIKMQGINQRNKINVLDRKTGQFIANAKLLSIQYKYQDKDGIYLANVLQTFAGNANGVIDITKQSQNYNNTFALVKGTDTFIIGENESYSINRYYNNSDNLKPRRSNFIFTDRSIYRPGQTVYFKGIVLESKGNKDHKTIANQSVKVIFRDANYQTIKELELTTNAYGSFSGSFIAPTTGLMGNMTIGTAYGSTSINVEEYKRPKFEITFDTLKSNYQLKETIAIKGKAIAYAGNNIDNAEVKYRVVREVRYPYFWLYRGPITRSASMEIANGISHTDENGAFTIDFEAIPDPSVDPKSLPIFNYTISVDITDINGETRSQMQNVAIGYHTLDVQLTAATQSIASNFKSLNLRTTNLNGVFSPTNVKLNIHQLQSPDKLYKDRLWKMPTDFLYDENIYKQYFPNDVYKDEWKTENRKRVANIWSENINSTVNGKVDIPQNIWKTSGFYEIEAIAKDKSGKDIVQKTYVYVFVPGTAVQNDQGLFVASNQSNYQPSEKMELYVIPAISNANLIQQNNWNKIFTSGKNPNLVTIQEADRGTKKSAWIYIYNNRIYEVSHETNIPWNNKDLSISWATHRDKLLPGANEEWTLTIKGEKKEAVAAELVAGLYDASLDALKPHRWNWSKLYGSDYQYFYWNKFGFGTDSKSNRAQNYYLEGIDKEYPYWTLPEIGIGYISTRNYKSASMVLESGAVPGIAVEEGSDDPNSFNPGHSTDKASGRANFRSKNAVNDADGNADEPANAAPKTVTLQDSKDEEAKSPTPAIRSNLNETAFFIPQLQTDADGNIKIKFTIPEALTQWNFMAFAHTPDWKTGYLSGSIQTQKELMVTPNLPRFFRQGDKMTIAAKISNLSDKALKGKAKIEIVDAQTMQVLNLPFGFKDNEQSFSAAAQQSAVVNFDINVPQAIYEPVIVRIVATAGDFSDGEEHMIPVVSNRMLVTETQPLPVRGNTTETFSLDKLLQSGNSNTLLNKSLTVEFTGNPAWYAVQALPYLMEFPYECAEQTFNRFYANALAGHIVAQSPKIAAIFDNWRTSDTAALLSNLEKNQELKTALLEETPWVLEAKSEKEQKQNIAKLFATHQLAKGLNSALDKLAKMQNSDGSFSWFKGMKGNRYITQYILTGMAKLQALNVKAAQDKDIQKMLRNGLAYLDTETLKDYRQIKKENLKHNNLSNTHIQYLYLRSFLNTAVSTDAQIAYNYYLGQEKQFWMNQNNYMQGMIALTQFRKADKPTANTIMESLSERALRSKEMGMYWNSNRSYWWYELPIETHSLLITAFEEIKKDEKTVDDLKVWLLKQKQTQNWKTTTATADAVYALLRSGTDWLQYEPEVVIQLGNMTIRSTDEKTEAGTGYFKKQIEGKDVNPQMGNIKVSVDNKTGKNTGTAWGAVYWQYFENMDKIAASAGESPLHISKQLYIETSSDRGPILKEISANQVLKVGDKVKVRIVLKVDRAMEYVHMKDMRAAGFEPVNVLSGYKWDNGLGYYESTKDIATHFFFDYLPKGTFVFEYPLIVSQKGTFSNGITTAQSMYAPEFSSHTEGIKVEVK